MPQKIKFELNREGIKELLKSPKAEEICKEYANKAMMKLGSGYGVTTYKGQNRVNASVSAESAEAINENLNNNTILKAVLGRND